MTFGGSLAYTRWLELARLYPRFALTPTREIDRVWHEHMTDPAQYAADCLRFAGYVPEHNERPSVRERRKGFSRLRRLWKLHFNEQLTGAPAVCDKRAHG